MDDERPKMTKDQVRKRFQAEGLRNALDEFSDALESDAVERALERLPEFKSDVLARVTIHSIIGRFDSHIPKNLRERYIERRADFAWLEDEVEVRGTLSVPILKEVAHLAVSAREYHRRLAALRRRP